MAVSAAAAPTAIKGGADNEDEDDKNGGCGGDDDDATPASLLADRERGHPCPLEAVAPPVSGAPESKVGDGEGVGTSRGWLLLPLPPL